MTVQLHAFTCGHLTLPLGFMLAGHDGTITVPVPAYLITHPKGTVLFDSGLHPSTQRDPVAHVGDGLASFHDFHFDAGEDLGARLESIDLDPASVTYIVNSHLHFDHCGGNVQVPNATVIWQQAELDAARHYGTARGYVSADFETGHDTDLLDGERDLFGDGTVVCFPTPGHTPGHQSLRVRTERGGEFVLCGDACYLARSLEALVLPGVIADADAALASLHLFGRLRDAGARIMFGHDPDFWTTVTQAPARLG